MRISIIAAAAVLATASLAFGGSISGSETYNIYNYEGLQIVGSGGPLAVTQTPTTSIDIGPPTQPMSAPSAPTSQVILFNSDAPIVSSASPQLGSQLVFANSQVSPAGYDDMQSNGFKWGHPGSPVPESSTWVLLGAGLALIVIGRRAA